MKDVAYFILCNFLVFSNITIAADTIGINQSISDGETLVSLDEKFELGFFSPGSSKNRYVGIWYKNIPDTVVWVANRNNPLIDLSGVVKIDENGSGIVLINGTGSVFWLASSLRSAGNPVVQLLKSGNLVLRDESSDNIDSYLWQSFDYPCDTLLPSMKVGISRTANRNWNLSSWNNTSDPSPGVFTYSLDQQGLVQFVLRRGSEIMYRTGQWDGAQFGGVSEMKNNSIFHPIVLYNTEEVYYTFENNENTTISRFVVTQSGLLQHFKWDVKQNEWINIVTMQKDTCDQYARCGAYGTCKIDHDQVCSCLKGFIPRSSPDWSAGCVRNVPVNCVQGEEFYKLRGLKLPDSSYFFVNKSRVSAERCKMICLTNCSCTAYATTAISGCVLWAGDVTDIREFSEGGQDLYIRLAASEFGKQKDARIIILSVVLTAILISGLGYLFWKWRTKQRGNRNGVVLCNTSNDTSREFAGSNMIGANPELPIFNFEKLVIATDNFSVDNKLGRGGFGSVYKGKFPDGQEIAVKRLSKRSEQGSEEFMNEVVVISKLQHRNLVRLVGCCIEGEEKMLVYEYLPNKGLDSFLFDPKKQSLLDWRKRFQIIEGIGRGTLYLHRDSRLKVIHRDLKASNILLDEELNPKISDFGMARIFGGNEVQADTRRVVGTYGYMSPEYAMKGRFSEKSDVFSFGVLLLEIVSGKRNSSFSNDDESPSLLGYAWELWNEDNSLALIDPGLSKPPFQEEILRCIHVGLLCVQDFVEDRPSMSIVLSMLTSEMVHLPPPKQPAFTERHISSDLELREKIRKSGSINVSITEIHGR
ncbi:hypothetical protein GIB67_032666 [Kingdonia uniflora]|uniref:Receptor-like serine/threonine-protein kinase n=1 Tax=Kingdonia uniflora TaxID=39325 RepID=A0A7J7MVT4_9MAGN|nr:hypothetical protein GIB67_032666 [Kingdonia uniflora]